MNSQHDYTIIVQKPYSIKHDVLSQTGERKYDITLIPSLVILNRHARNLEYQKDGKN